jgi:hypothetical protein
MNMKTHLMIWTLAAAVVLLVSPPADATFHLMQIEQVIGGVNGDTSAQAIQLRMRFNGQGGVSQARLVAHDAAGQNPVVVIDFMSDVTPEVQGGWILITSPGFAADTTPTAVPDFTMTNVIPTSYLAAGSLTYETNRGVVLWRLSWGGAAYTGSNQGASTIFFNDRDGNFGPPYPGPLPTAGTEALQFQGAVNALSTTNAHDYALTSGPATFTNVQGQSFTINP